ncbi:MAG: class I SAM-dependent methyltransferase [Rhodocyclaceae bacterium]|nr:class I SAM-dependent methyltransferase [Rhodocyclaceae bacterium]
MTAATDRYAIRADYRENLVQATFDSSGDPAYWNEGRLLSAATYQWDVYETAARLVRERHLKSLLDVGSGPPVKLKTLMPSGLDICLVDQPNTAQHAAEMLPAARFFAANLDRDLPAIGRTFDLVLSADVVEHLVDPDPCLDFMRRHLAPGGLLLISTPERDALRGRDCADCPHPMHVREWSFREFGRFLSSRGLEILEQRRLPQQRSSTPRKAFGRLMAALGRPPSWYSCQLAICRARD